MTLQELGHWSGGGIRDNKTTPHLINNNEINANLNEAQREACVRALLIKDKR